MTTATHDAETDRLRQAVTLAFVELARHDPQAAVSVALACQAFAIERINEVTVK